MRATTPAGTRVGTRTGTLSLGSSLSIREVGQCAIQLRALIAAGGREIDARRLESVDTAGLQLLLAAALEARRRGSVLTLRGAAGLHASAASAVGLAEHLSAAAQILP
jgi:ABC-type transporter Mla MlaB component